MLNKKRFFWISEHPEYEKCPGEVIAEEEDHYVVADDKGQHFKLDKHTSQEILPILRKTVDSETRKSIQDGGLDILSEIHQLTPNADSFMKTPMSFGSNTNSKTHTRFSSEVEYLSKDRLKKMQDELDFLRKENAELKLGKLLIPIEESTDLNNVQERSDSQENTQTQPLQNLESNLEEIGKREFKEGTETEELNLRISELEQLLQSKEEIVNNLNEKISCFGKKQEAIEKENKLLKEEIKKRENFLQQKLQLEVDIKRVQREKKEQDIKLEGINKENKNLQDKISEKDQELKGKLEYMKQIEKQLQDLQSKFNELQSSKEKVDERSFIENSNKENKDTNIKETGIEQDALLSKLKKENQISKEVNQTFIKLLKLKTLQFQTVKIGYGETGSLKSEAQKNLEKFQSEEKKLHLLLASLTKKYEALEGKSPNEEEHPKQK